ncbi:1813_t:CDS:1, partial [Paraglomus occultum]
KPFELLDIDVMMDHILAARREDAEFFDASNRDLLVKVAAVKGIRMLDLGTL